MLTKKDLQLIGQVVDQKLDARFESFEKKMDDKFDKQRREIMEDTQSLIQASEKRVVHQICEFIDDAILPQINNLRVKAL